MIVIDKIDQFELVTASTLQDVRILKNDWHMMATHPSVDPDVRMALWENSDSSTYPYVLCVRKGGVPVGFLVATIKSITVELKLHYFTLIRIPAKVMAVLDNGMIGSQDPTIARTMLSSIANVLSNKTVDYIHLACVQATSPIRHIIKSHPRKLLVLDGTLEPRWRLKLGASFEEFLASRSRKTRNNIRRREKKLLSAFPDVEVKTIYPGSNEGDLYEHVQRVIQTTYQYRLGITPLKGPSSKEYWARLFELNRLAACVIFINGHPKAFSWAHIYKNTALFGTPGYDPDYREWNIGEFCNIKLIQELIKLNAVRTLDYGLGYAQYKETFGTDFEMEGHIRLFSATPKGCYLALCIRFFDLLNRMALSALERLGLKQRLKKKIRFGLS